MPDNDISFPIITDVDTLSERINVLTDSYRLFVGAAEELTRTPSATEEIITDAIVRTAFLGNILDQLLILLQISIIVDVIGPEKFDGLPNPYL